MEKKKFKLEQVLSVTNDILFCEIGKVYEILNYLTGDNLFTHQLPRACRICRIPLLRQFPFLKDIDTDGVNTENWRERLAVIKEKFPKELELSPIENWTHINPMQELSDIVGDDSKIIAVIPASGK